MTQRGWEELRPYLRHERAPDDTTIVVRGGPDTPRKARGARLPNA